MPANLRKISSRPCTCSEAILSSGLGRRRKIGFTAFRWPAPFVNRSRYSPDTTHEDFAKSRSTWVASQSLCLWKGSRRVPPPLRKNLIQINARWEINLFSAKITILYKALLLFFNISDNINISTIPFAFARLASLSNRECRTRTKLFCRSWYGKIFCGKHDKNPTFRLISF